MTHESPPRPKTRLFVAPSRRATVVTLLVAVALAVSAGVAQVWTHQRAIELGYGISRLTNERDRLLERHRRLRIELELLKSPERVGRIAADDYGMRPPEPEQIHRLRAVGKETRDRVADTFRRWPRTAARRAGFGGQP